MVKNQPLHFYGVLQFKSKLRVRCELCLTLGHDAGGCTRTEGALRLRTMEEALGAPHPSSSKRGVQCFDRLGVPVAERKLVGPTDCLTFLGIKLDTTHMIRRLPAHKLRELKELVEEWLPVGKLQHACKVVCPGRTFLRRMFKLLKGGASKQPWVRLNTRFRSDLLWWHQFLESWNEVAVRSAVVAPVLGVLEWSGDARKCAQTRPRGTLIHRCIRVIWWRGILGEPLASIKVARGVGGMGNCTERVDTYSCGMYGLGPAMVAAESQDLLRQ